MLLLVVTVGGALGGGLGEVLPLKGHGLLGSMLPDLRQLLEHLAESGFYGMGDKDREGCWC